MPSVYIETTIPSYFFETRNTPQVIAWRDATRLWWDRYRHGYDLYSSRGVRSELSRSPNLKSQQSLQLLETIKLLDEPPGLADVIQYYLEHKLMPGGMADSDAYHVAIASMRSMDFLLTWNCRHFGQR